MNTYVFNIGTLKGSTDEQINTALLNRAMQKLNHGVRPKCIIVDVPQGKEYTEIYGAKIYEPTDIYIIQSNWVDDKSIRDLCAQFEQDAIPYAIYDECYRPVHADLIYSEECIKQGRYEWGRDFNPEYFATPFKGDLTSL